MEHLLYRTCVGSAALASLFLPMTAFAYLSPQEVFNPTQSEDATTSMIQTQRFDGYVPAPPTTREGEDVVKAQQDRAAALRTEAQKELKSVDSAPVDSYVPPEAPKAPSRLDNQTNYELRQMRKAASDTGGPTIVIAGQGVTVDADGNVLHSGAPLITGTGPATILGIAVLVLAALSTIGSTLLRRHLIAAH